MFTNLKYAIDKQMQIMKEHTLLVTAAPKDDMWDKYLSSFPEGTDPIHKERTEHDCQCCKQFIRKAGSMVAIIDGDMVSIWDCEVDGFYGEVAAAMAAFVKSFPIKNKFLHYENYVGTDKSHQDSEDGVITWDHFYHKLAPSCVMPKSRIDTELGRHRTSIETFARAVNEITDDAIDTVLELIQQNSIYRGVEYLPMVKELKKQKAAYELGANKDEFLWANPVSVAVAGIRNTSIGSLLVDLSDNVDLNQAVGKYEAKVAPENYKRPSALITKGMLKKAEETIINLGFEDTLYRRYANFDDITAANTVWANRDAKKKMGVFEEMASDIPDKKPNLDRVEDVSIDDFINNILPTVTSMELMLENSHKNNFMSLIAPEYQFAPNMLKWDNNFSWSYNGDVTDSMKDRVKTAGGSVDGVLRATIQWNEEGNDGVNDLDLHCNLPGGHIYFSSKRHTISGGWLDVDITVPASYQTPGDDIAVENISWQDIHKMPDGDYHFIVNNFSGRNTNGFRAQIEIDGTIHDFSYNRSVTSDVRIATVTLKDGKLSLSKSNLESSTTSKEIWGINTQKYISVSMVMNSPNYWDKQTQGNKHWFFILSDCNNPDNTRGFYNEFLSNDLTEHRKVFEMLGSKLKAKHSDNQLSGLGFSSTKRSSVLCKVTGSFSRLININF